MNPNDNTQNPNSNINQSSDGPFVTPTPIGFSMPQMGAAPVNSVPVQGTPVQNTVAPQTPVQPTPMPAAPSPVTPTPMPATPAPVTPSPMASEITKEDPNAKLTEVNVPPSMPTTEQPQVINTVKSKGSNFLLFIIIVVLVAFAINIDKMAEMYDNYMKTGSLTSTTITPDNTTGGFIKIDESSSSMKISEINFYNFRKTLSDLTISFNYEAFQTYEDSTSLNLYIELYNANKELLYKELFNTGGKIEKSTTSNYTMKLDSDVHESAFYALVKTYSDSELSTTSELTCKFYDNNYQYENKYYFTNNSLVKYDVMKKSNDVGNTKLEEEYNSLNGKVQATYQNGTLKYSVDLDKDTTISPIYPKGLTPTIVKSRDTLKKWNCE